MAVFAAGLGELRPMAPGKRQVLGLSSLSISATNIYTFEFQALIRLNVSETTNYDIISMYVYVRLNVTMTYDYHNSLRYRHRSYIARNFGDARAKCKLKKVGEEAALSNVQLERASWKSHPIYYSSACYVE